MAVPGKKVSDFSGHASKGSADDFDHGCEPCLDIGQHEEAHGFCLECQQYLCQSCIAYHHRITATKHHQLLDKDNMSKQSTTNKDATMCKEKCTIHKNEIIKFFCTNHEHLGCSVCITLNHKTCKIDYILDKCVDIEKSDEYRETLKDIDQKMKDMKAINDQAKHQDKELEVSFKLLTQDIEMFRKEMNNQLDILQMKLEEKAKELNNMNKETITKVLQTCSSVSSDMMEIKSSLQESKTCQENAKTYILMKQAQFKLKTDDAMIAKESLEEANVPYTFERNKELESVLTKQDMFGSISLLPTKQSFRMMNKKLTHKANMNVRTKSDKSECYISGCAALSTNRVVLADRKNSKLKMVDLEREEVTEEKTFDSKPFDIAVLPQDQIAVTIPAKGKIFVLATADKLSIIRKIKFSKGVSCRGISYHQEHLYVVCWHPNCLLLTDTQGNVRNKINLKNEIFHNPNNILLSKDSEHIYVSEYDSNSIVSVTLKGDISAVYKHKDLDGPFGMVMLEDGTLLVCCFMNDTIHQISGDLEQGKILQDGLQSPHTICYNHTDREIYICGVCDQLIIMKLLETK